MINDKDISLLPHSVEAEKAVLGSIFLSPNNFDLVIDKASLTSEQFFVDLHRRIFDAMASLHRDNHQIDVITLSDILKKDGASSSEKLTPVFLVELTEGCPVAQNVEYYAQIIKKNYYLRRVIRSCHTTIQKAQSFSGATEDFIGNIEQEFLQIVKEQDTGDGLIPAKDVLLSTLEDLENRIKNEGSVTGVASGFFDLDKITGGWQKSDLIIVAGRPGMGKTAIALNWALNAIKSEQSNSIAIFTLEMSRNQLMERLLSSEGRIDSTNLRKGNLTEEDQDRLMQAARTINENGSKIVIDETPGITLSEIRSRCKRFKKEMQLDLIIIDYLQLMSGSETAKKQGREREISEISMGLKSLAKELSVPVIAVAQLNRGPDSRPDKRPKISDLRESGSMEQDADQILFVYRDDYYNPNSELAGKAEVIIAKNRHGETASVYLAWLPNYVAFHNLIKE